jgi:hypothetical protein
MKREGPIVLDSVEDDETLRELAATTGRIVASLRPTRTEFIEKLVDEIGDKPIRVPR